jgi:hypothetical protein
MGAVQNQNLNRHQQSGIYQILEALQPFRNGTWGFLI